MSNGYIPKERLTAYERWEVAAFDEAERMSKAMQEAEAQAQAELPAAEPIADEPPREPEVTPEALAAIRAQAFAEGRAAGFEDGFATGRAEGYASGEAQIRPIVASIATLATHFSQSVESSEAKLAEDLLTLSLDIAAQVIRSSLKSKPELLLPVVREAIAALANPHGHPVVAINPGDAELIKTQLGEQLAHTNWRIVEDSQIARGGCRIENSGAEVDATLPTRWRRVVDALGRQSDWLDSE